MIKVVISVYDIGKKCYFFLPANYVGTLLFEGFSLKKFIYITSISTPTLKIII